MPRWISPRNLSSFRYRIQLSLTSCCYIFAPSCENEKCWFRRKSLRFASWMWFIGKHHARLFAAVWEKRQRLSHPDDTVLKRGTGAGIKNAIGRLPMAWEQKKEANICISTLFYPVNIWLFWLHTKFLCFWKHWLYWLFYVFLLVLPLGRQFFSINKRIRFMADL